MRTLCRLATLAATLSLAAACTESRSPVAPSQVRPSARPAFASGSAAAFTSIDATMDAVGGVTIGDLCKNGNPAVNCNIYGAKSYVWLNGGPIGTALGDGTYFFAVLAPSGQADPNDGSADLLSSDAQANRTFGVSGGVVSYAGSHTLDGTKIRLMDYADTPNPGGVYILAICSLANGSPVTPSRCKYDAFKVRSGSSTNPDADAPLVIKDATPGYDRTYRWGITKSADPTLVRQIGGSASIKYTVSVTHDGGTVSNVNVSGLIQAINPNEADIVDASISDALVLESSGATLATCTVNGGTQSGLTLVPGNNAFAYSCDLGSALPSGSVSNTVTLSWSQQSVDGRALTGGTASWLVSSIAFGNATRTIDGAVTVTDKFGALGAVAIGTLLNPAGGSTVSASDPSPTSFVYTRAIAVTADACVTYPNTAALSTGETAHASVTICGATGGHTMGFWQNSNGQGLIKTYSSAAARDYLRTFNVFQDLSASATGAQVASYVSGIIGAASCADADKACNRMLRAQMLSTALSVFYTGPGYTSTQVGSVKAPSNFMSNTNLGTRNIDLTKVCTNIPTCSSFQNVSSAFGGASSATVSAMLAFENTVATATTGAAWYGQVKATQVLAKNAFDAINNKVAIVAP